MAMDAKITNRILGLPLKFTANTDPMGRTYFENFLCQANILNIVPGKPRFWGGSLRKEKLEILNNAINANLDTDGSGGLFSNIGLNRDVSVDDASYSSGSWKHGALGRLLDGELKERDIRFYSFSADYRHFHKQLNMLFHEFAAKMDGLSLTNNVNSYFDTSHWGDFGISFWVEGTSQCSESISNEIGETSAASQSAQKSDAAREAAFMTGRSTGDVYHDKMKIGMEAGGRGFGEGIASGISGITAWGKQKLAGLTSFFTGNYNAVKEEAGERIVFPKMWRNATYDKNYNLAFRFISPYGDPESIFEYVYAPFIILLAMALPKQYSADSYGAPPLLRFDCPGNFCCDMGIISSMSWQKGTSQELWTSKGYPLGIDVNISVTDVYPSLSCPVNYSLLKQNIGIEGMIDNMCGLNVMQSHIWKNAKASIAGRLFAPVGGWLGGGNASAYIGVTLYSIH